MDSKSRLKEKLVAAQSMMAWALKSEAAPRINAMLDLARSEPGIPVLADQLDQDSYLFNCPNGTLELRTGRLREHRREDYITKMCPTEYHPEATCPAWEKFLVDIFPETPDAGEEPDNKELIDFVQRLLGYCLTGDVSEQILPIFWGNGANGKSTLINAVMETLGGDYTMKANQELLVVHRSERHSTERMDLFGKRFVVASETGQGARLNEPFIKDLTGGERIRGRRMKEDQWEFNPTHKIVLLTNHMPEVRGNDLGIWRRLLLVPFEATFWNPDDPGDRAKRLPENLKQDKRLPLKLWNERPGILAWMVRGCLEWQASGLRIPKRVQLATEAYREGENLFSHFLEECCLVGPAFRVRAKVIHDAYRQWCESNGETPLKQKAFGALMTERNFGREKSNGTWYLGVAVRDDG